jgi:Fe-S cluster assembly protein SufD
MAGIGRAPEGSAPASRLHERQSFDPADFAVPAGREEEWRFTPLRRLRGLPDDAPLAEGKVTVETDPAPEVAASRAERGASPGLV